MLLNFAKNGCPVNCGSDWTRDEIVAALRRGPHPSARQQNAAQALHKEVHDKVAQGYAKIVKWKDIKNNLPANLKLSPVAQIPHKSRSFRTILDLSYELKHNGARIPSVNRSTALQAPEQSMSQLGPALTRFIQRMADNYDLNTPFAFIKFDIKDGFWRMAVHPDDAWNFAYVLPALKPIQTDDDLEIVVPFALQMGWCESPPLFGTGSETARDVTQALKDEECDDPHPLESLVKFEVPNMPHPPRNRVEMLEVYVDDFFAGTNDLRRSNLLTFTRALLHGIHLCFPPPSITGHSGEDPVSTKKILNGEGFWQFQKEILGWIVDGKTYTITLSDEKRKKYISAIKTILKQKRVPAKNLEKVVGKLGHVAIGVPAGKGLLTPLYKAQVGNPTTIITTTIKQPLEDWIQLLHSVASKPTDVRELTPALPDYLEYNDASKWGAGGVIWGPHIPRMVWRVAWPDDVRNALNNPKSPHRLAINDLELAALLLGWLCLEFVCPDLVAAHVGIYSDNTPTVAWANRLASSTSTLASFLLRALALRLRTRQASPLLCASIRGKDNTMADTSSRTFRGTNGRDTFAIHLTDFLTFFNNKFPLQSGSWVRCHPPASWISRVMCCLRGQPLTMASWNALPKPAGNTGSNGATTREGLESIPTSGSATTTYNATSSSQHSLLGSGLDASAEDVRSQFKPLLTRYRPSPRPSNWLENPPLSTKRRKRITFPSDA